MVLVFLGTTVFLLIWMVVLVTSVGLGVLFVVTELMMHSVPGCLIAVFIRLDVWMLHFVMWVAAIRGRLRLEATLLYNARLGML